MNTLLQSSPNTYARLTGLLYLLIAIAGGFSMGYLPTIILAPGDAATTAQNIIVNQGLYQLGIFADMVVFLSETILLVALYMLFKSVSQTVAFVSLTARMGMVVIIAFNAILDIIPLVLLSGADYLAVFDQAQIHATVLMLIEIETYGVAIWQIFFTVHMLALGYLVFKSGFVPRAFGVLMVIGSFGYAINSIEMITALNTSASSWLSVGLLTIVALSEIGFGLWLLIRGINTEKWAQTTPAAIAS